MKKTKQKRQVKYLENVFDRKRVEKKEVKGHYFTTSKSKFHN